MTPSVILSEAKNLTCFFGIDLTSREAEPSACVCLKERLQVVYLMPNEKLRSWVTFKKV